MMGVENQSEMVNENLSALISSQNIFPHDSDQLYYFVREGYVCDAKLYSWRAEGFCKKVKVICETIDGSLQIDGYFKHDIGIGDTFTVSSRPEYSLKCIRLGSPEIAHPYQYSTATGNHCRYHSN